MKKINTLNQELEAPKAFCVVSLLIAYIIRNAFLSNEDLTIEYFDTPKEVEAQIKSKILEDLKDLGEVYITMIDSFPIEGFILNDIIFDSLS